MSLDYTLPQPNRQEGLIDRQELPKDSATLSKSTAIKVSTINILGEHSAVSSNPVSITPLRSNSLDHLIQASTRPQVMEVEKGASNVKICTKLMSLPHNAYCYSAPEVKEPASWAHLTPEQKEIKTSQCLEAYGAARAEMEKSVSIVSAKHPDTLDFVDKLCDRVFDVIKAETLMNFVEQHRRQPSADEFTLAVNSKLVQLFGKPNPSQGGGVGMNPLGIRKVFTEGNLREKMYIPFKSTYEYTQALFQDPKKLEGINAHLKKLGCDWSVDTSFANLMKEQTVKVRGGFYGYAPMSRTAREEDVRESRSPADKAAIANRLALPLNSEERVTPLSRREMLAAVGEVPQIAQQKGLDSEKVKWQPGYAWIRPKTKTEVSPELKSYTYLCGVESLRAPQVGGISGTTDNILTLARCLSLSSEKELKQGRLALIGWMVPEHNHSVHEIMTAGKAFELDYHPRADDYRDIYPDDPHFVDKVLAEQQKKGFQMPDTYLSPSD